MTDFTSYEKIITILLTFISFILTLGLWLISKIREDYKETNKKLITTDQVQIKLLEHMNHVDKELERHEKMHDEHYKSSGELNKLYASLDCVNKR